MRAENQPTSDLWFQPDAPVLEHDGSCYTYELGPGGTRGRLLGVTEVDTSIKTWKESARATARATCARKE